jgi:hypothetical protein
MRASLDNLKMEEAIHGFWDIDPSNVQLESSVESDPICSSAGCTQYKLPDDGAHWPMDYPVPNFGVDHDIKASHEDLKIAEAQLGHQLVIPKVEKPAPQYSVPDFGVDEEIKYA